MQTIVDKIKEKLNQYKHNVGYITLSVNHKYEHFMELRELGLHVTYDEKIDENKFYIT